MAANKLTDVAIRALKPKASHYTVSDGGGLSIRVFPNGRKLWLLRKMSAGKSVSMTLGAYPEMSLAQARAKAQSQSSSFVDHRFKDSALDSSMNLAQVCELYFNSKQLRKKTLKVYRIRFSHLKSLADLELSQITPLMARAAVAKLLVANKIATARNCLSLLGTIERFACGLGLVSSPRLQFVKTTLPRPETEHFRSIDAELLPQVFQGLARPRKKARKDTSLKSFYSLTLLLFTLLRTHEAISLRWEYVDFDAGCIVVPASIMKKGRAHRVPITSQLNAMLKTLKERYGGERVLGFVTTPSSFSRAIAFAGFYDSLTAHGVRSMARGYFAKQGFDFIASEYCLAHQVENGIQLAYQRTDYLEQRRIIMQHWCDYVESCYKDFFQL